MNNPIVAVICLVLLTGASGLEIDEPFTSTNVEHWEDGGLKSIRHLDAEGKKVGMHFGWWPNGTLKFQYAFENGLHEGQANEWLSDGSLFRAFNYVDGKESGLQRMWYEGGSLRANYVIKNGRRFGLMGSKPCV
jgi:antitoxin component YwqK of YwqJK toxin-antitoxin module